MFKTIRIDDKDVEFKSSAATIRIYRERFGRDLLLDFQKIRDEAAAGETWSADALLAFENFAFVTAKQADPSIPDDPDEWLDQFEMLSIYQIWPQLVDLWEGSNATTSSSKKKE